MQPSRFLLPLLASLLWALAIGLSVRELPVGMTLESAPGPAVSAVNRFPDGTERESPRTAMRKGRNVLWVDRHASSFHFKFHCPSGAGEHAVPLSSIDIGGIPALSPEQIVRFNMRTHLHRSLPEKGAPLLLHVSDGDVLDLPNVFPFVLRLLRLVRTGIAWGPFLICGLLVLTRLLGGKLLALAQRIVNCPPVFAGIGSGILLLTFPKAITPATPGLDPSWIWLFNRYAFEGAVGRDFVFTYGPLGFLIAPQLTSLNMWLGIGFNAVFILVLAIIIRALYGREENSVGRWCATALLVLWSLPWPNGMEWKWCVVSVMACLCAAFCANFPSRLRFLLFGFSAVSVVLLSFVKFSSCISVMGEHVVILAARFLRDRRGATKGLALYCVAFAATLAFCMAAFFPNLDTFHCWLKGSLEISSGYNLYMGSEKSWFELAGTIVPLAGLAAMVFRGNAGRWQGVLYWMLLSPLIFCTYKYAIVRQSSLPLALLLSWFTVIQVALTGGSRPRATRFVLLCLAVSAGTSVIWCDWTPSRDVSLGCIRQIVRASRTLRNSLDESLAACKSTRLPPHWRERIGTNLVMIAGWEMGPAMSGDLNLVPLPATQTYSAYTPYLDGLCASRIAEGKDVPEFILAPANPETFDARNIYFDNPRLWDAVRREYEFLDIGKDHVLLGRRKDPHARRKTSPAAGIPRFNLRRTVPGKLQSLFFRTPRTLANITLADGSLCSCSANVEVLDGTEVPRMLPTNTSQVPAFFGASNECPVVKSVRIIPADTFSLTGRFDY